MEQMSITFFFKHFIGGITPLNILPVPIVFPLLDIMSPVIMLLLINGLINAHNCVPSHGKIVRPVDLEYMTIIHIVYFHFVVTKYIYQYRCLL